MHAFSLGLAIALAILAQLLFKAFTNSPKAIDENIYLYLLNYKLILGLFLYFISATLYIFSLNKISLSVAYPSISISYIFIIFLSHFLFGETLTTYKIIGSIFIISGVGLIWK
jgi:drug/metabolite transporter (DMT)-like permease